MEYRGYLQFPKMDNTCYLATFVGCVRHRLDLRKHLKNDIKKWKLLLTINAI